MALPLVLIGLLGVGKSSVGKRLAERLALDFVDMDQLLEEQVGQSISTFFATVGEAKFRELESELLKKLIQNGKVVISSGGGVVLSETNRALLEKHAWCIRLDISLDALYERLQHDQSRPLLQGGELKQRLEQLQTQREAFYAACAQMTVKVDGKSIELICDEVIAQLEQMK